ncbi:MAG: aldose epimerase family protein [Trueperaceae bacterium]|nr:aldose epimerase family protein [Trueperaceae bacterium]
MTRHHVRADDGSGFAVLDFGGAITEVRVPDRWGRMRDVTLGWPDAAGYERNDAYLGVVIGRCANRVAGGELPVGGRTHALPRNEGRHHLHGGPGGFHVRTWGVRPVGTAAGPREEADGTDRDEGGVELWRISPAGEEGYPGRLEVRVRMTWSLAHALRIVFHATADAPTVVNLTQHPYWNLAGSGTILDHDLTVHADAYTPVDADGIPTGQIAPVTGTPFDLRAGGRLTRVVTADDPAIRAAGGLDHNYVLRPADPGVAGCTAAATLSDPRSGRRLQVRTTAPGLQAYSGNGLGGGRAGHAGRPYARHGGIALEAQGFPDAPHHPYFPSWAVTPEAPFRREVVYAFGADAR